MPAAGTFRPGTSSKKAASSYSDFFKGVTRPAVEPKSGQGGSSGTPIRRTGAVSKTPGGYNAFPDRVNRDKGIDAEAKAEALRRRLRKNAQVKKSAGKVNAKLKSRR